MADVSIEGSALLLGELWMQRAGNWSIVADKIDSAAALTEGAKVTVSWLGSELHGSVLRSRVTDDGFAQAVIVGGAGGIAKELDAKMYDNQILARIVAEDIAREAGEQLSPLAAQALLSAMGSWVRRVGQAGDQLSALCDALSFVWRTQLDGAIWVGLDSWQPVPDWEHEVPQGGWHPAYGCLEVVPRTIGALPGQRYETQAGGITIAGRIGCAVYGISKAGPSARLYFVDDRAPQADNLAEPLRAFVCETMRGVELLGTYTGKVAVQRSDGSLDVTPDDKRYPPLTGVRIRVPVPGAKLTVPAGSRCQLVFEGGDIMQRVATLYEPGANVSAVARVDDTVNLGHWAVTTAVIGTVTVVTSVTVISPNGGAPVPLAVAPAQQNGKISSGSPHLALPKD